MDRLKAKDIQVLSRAVKLAKPSVKLSALWRYLNAEYGIGELDKNNLNLTHTDYQNIRELVQNENNLDLFEPLPEGSRIDIARETGDEKLNAEAPGRHHILINSPSGKLCVNGLIIPLMIGASYRVDWREIDEKSFPKSIVVVENLQAFDYVQSFILPECLLESVVVYRGHNISSKAVIDFLQAAPENTQIIAFCDYDPKGFEIALTTTKVSHILLPELGQAFNGAYGTRSRFEQQYAAQTYVSNILIAGKLESYWKALIDQKLCVSQELVLAASKEMVLLALISTNKTNFSSTF
ncbi:MAG: hypothetical protein ACKE51_03820 [Methylococcaceae bacterium]